MGTFLTGYGDAAYDHEGYAAQVLDDGALTGTYSDTTRPRMVGQVVAACGCGWAGTTRYPTTTGSYVDEDAEELALVEWEHSHVRPGLRRLSLEGVERLRRILESLGRQAPGLAPDPLASLSPAERREVLERVLGTLQGALELTRELRDAHATAVAMEEK